MKLSCREIDALRLLAQGLRYADVAQRLGITRHTVAGYIKSAYLKLEVHSGSDAIKRAVALGLLR
jgi:DNA-binding CsgD family transcriptional regulator